MIHSFCTVLPSPASHHLITLIINMCAKKTWSSIKILVDIKICFLPNVSNRVWFRWILDIFPFRRLKKWDLLAQSERKVARIKKDIQAILNAAKQQETKKFAINYVLIYFCVTLHRINGISNVEIYLKRKFSKFPLIL